MSWPNCTDYDPGFDFANRKILKELFTAEGAVVIKIP
jgi:hypothetical protein